MPYPHLRRPPGRPKKAPALQEQEKPLLDQRTIVCSFKEGLTEEVSKIVIEFTGEPTSEMVMRQLLDAAKQLHAMLFPAAE